MKTRPHKSYSHQLDVRGSEGTAVGLGAQRGAVLFVALIFLLVLTVLGLAAIRATTQQVRMAANNQFQSAAFQAAETAIRTTMVQIRLSSLPTILVNAINTPQVVTPDFSLTDPNLSATATTTYLGDNFPADDASLDVAAGGLAGNRFEITANAQYGGTSASSTQRQGVQILGRNAN